mmetsp:Transcript_66606/g.56578  ORF Transcript_66606/g.56578 Transcript_66606/m.56578 type:complete len:101 (-) Transcript_66606:107-409(-)
MVTSETKDDYIYFDEFCKIYQDIKFPLESNEESEFANAFNALGGDTNNEDSFIDSEMLIKIIRDDFKMTIDIEKLIQDIDEDGSGKIEFQEFKDLLSGKQ